MLDNEFAAWMNDFGGTEYDWREFGRYYLGPEFREARDAKEICLAGFCTREDNLALNRASRAYIKSRDIFRGWVMERFGVALVLRGAELNRLEYAMDY